MNKKRVDGYTRVLELLDRGVDIECPVIIVDYYKSIKEFYKSHEVWNIVGKYIHLCVNENDLDDWMVLVDDDIPEHEFQILVGLASELNNWIVERFDIDENE